MNETAPIVKRILKYQKSGIVLDLGSGAGRHAIFLAKQGFSVTAVDRSAEKLKLLRSVAKKDGLSVRTIRADIATYKPKLTYDVVVALMSLHYLTGKRLEAAIRMMRTSTKPGGLNAISVFTDRHPAGTRPHLFRRNELKGYYDDWRVLTYEEKLSAPFFSEKQDKKIRQHRAVLLARKPA